MPYYGMKRCRFCRWNVADGMITIADNHIPSLIGARSYGCFLAWPAPDHCRLFYSGGVLPELAVDAEAGQCTG